MTSADPFPNWPSEKYRITDAAHLHALGQFSVLYNTMEDAISWIFNYYFPANKDYAERLFHDLNNRVRIDMLKAIIEQVEKDTRIKDNMIYALWCFDICTENRNTLMHAMMGGTNETIFQLAKRSRKNPLKFLYYKLPIDELRSIADACAETYMFIFQLTSWVQEEEWEDGPGPFPDKPTLPRRLNSSQPEQAGKDVPI